MKELFFIATAYFIGCDAPGPHTKMGTPPVPYFTIAADPRVLPLGTQIMVVGVPAPLGRHLVEDIGGGIKGRRIDIYVNSCKEAVRFGRKKVKVRVFRQGR